MVKRVVSAARKAGVEVNAVRVEPDGSVTIFQNGIEPPSPPNENPDHSKWLDVEA